MKIVIDYEPDPDFSWCEEVGDDPDELVSLCTLLYDGDQLVGSLSDIKFIEAEDDWTIGTFDSVEQIPERCVHLRSVATDLIAEYAASLPPMPPPPPFGDIRAAAQAALDYLDDDCEPHWSPEQRSVVESLRAALR